MPASSDKIADLLPGFANYMESATRLLPLTREHYVKEIRLFTKVADVSRVSQITPQVIIDWIGLLVRTWGAQSTIVKKKSALKRFLTYLEDFQDNKRAGELAKVLDKIEVRSKQKEPARKPFALSHEQFEKMLAVTETYQGGLREKAMLMFFWDTGVRREELANIKVQDIDLQDRTATITGKREKTRIIVFTTECQEVLQQWLQARQNWGPPECDNVFVTWNGRPLSLYYINVLVKRLGKKAGLRKDIYPHLFRHSALTDLLNRDMHVQDVATFAGHSNINTTFRYFHKDASGIKSAYDKAKEGKKQ